MFENIWFWSAVVLLVIGLVIALRNLRASYEKEERELGITHVSRGDVRDDLNIEGTETGRLSHTESHIKQVERKPKQQKSRSRKK